MQIDELIRIVSDTISDYYYEDYYGGDIVKYRDMIIIVGSYIDMLVILNDKINDQYCNRKLKKIAYKYRQMLEKTKEVLTKLEEK